MQSDVKVSELMTKNVITAKPGDNVSSTISKMTKLNLHELPVVDEKNKLMGYFSFEILLRKKHIPLYTKIENLMLHSPKIDKNKNIFEAAKLMLETGFRAIPVVNSSNGNELAGILSRTDIIKAIPKLSIKNSENAGNIMTPQPKTVEEDDNIEKALRLMLELEEVAAPVVNETKRVVGAVNISEISRAMWYHRESESYGELTGEKIKPDIEVKGFISPIATCREDENIREICRNMSRINPYICAVVDEEHKIKGVITQYDILKKLVEYSEKKEKGVYVDITGLSINDPFVYSSIFAKIERLLKKVARFSWIELYTLNLHVERHGKAKPKWSMRAKLRTNKGLLYVKNHDYSLLKCVDEILEELEKRIMSMKRF